MLRDGEKYACKACIRGHRVSSCQHADRELFHINKKGRPVSQCQHCRGLRKSRAAHVKCDCAEHHHDPESTLGKDDCPCVTGAKCTCAFKKELADIDEDSKPSRSTAHKPAFQARRSDGSVPKVRADGTHHPQHHRTNNSAHQFGIPYTIKRLHHEYSPADTLFSPASAIDFAGFDFANSSSSTATAAAAQPYPSYIPSSPHDTRLTRSAHASPILGPITNVGYDISAGSRGTLDPQPSATESTFWNAQFAAAQRHSINDFSNFSLDALDGLDLYAADYEEPANAASLLGTDWSQIGFNSALDPNPAQDYYPQPPSNASIDFSLSGRPELSHSSSGTASDVGEPIPTDFSQLTNSFQPVSLDPSYGMLNSTLPNNYDLMPAVTNNLNLMSSLDLSGYGGSVDTIRGGSISNTGVGDTGRQLFDPGDQSLSQPLVKTESFDMRMPFTPQYSDVSSLSPSQPRPRSQMDRSVSHTPPSLPGLAMPNLPEGDDEDDTGDNNAPGDLSSAEGMWANYDIYGNVTEDPLSGAGSSSAANVAGIAPITPQPHWI